MRVFFRLVFKCAVPACMLVLLPGCSTLTETSAWKKTSGLYYTYVNRPVKLDLTSAEALPEGESRLASRLMALDWQLTGLERTLEAMGVPDQNAPLSLAFRSDDSGRRRQRVCRGSFHSAEAA